MIPRQQNLKNRLAGWMGMSDVHDRKLNIIADYDLTGHAKDMVEADGCHAPVPESCITSNAATGLCSRPLSPGLEIQMAMIWKRYRPFTKNMDYFCRLLREEEW